MSDFPHIIFGRCQICGGRGGDAADPGPGNAPARNTTGNGLVLEWYDGKLTCNTCKSIQIAKEESLVAADKHAEEKQFRARAGFLNRVPD